VVVIGLVIVELDLLLTQDFLVSLENTRSCSNTKKKPFLLFAGPLDSLEFDAGRWH
jgi:hypothetical protein